MYIWIERIVTALMLVAVLTGCASTPEMQAREEAKRQTVASILSEPLDASEYVETRRCLSNYRHIEILDDRMLVFEGSGKKLWLNELPIRCPGLRRNSTLALRTDSSFGRLCKMDSVAVVDWFGYPWFRRWPWHWANGPRCTLGEFQPVSITQVQAIKQAISNRSN